MANSITYEPLIALALDGSVGGDKICPHLRVLWMYLILWPQSLCRMKPDDWCRQLRTILLSHVLQSSYPLPAIACVTHSRRTNIALLNDAIYIPMATLSFQ